MKVRNSDSFTRFCKMGGKYLKSFLTFTNNLTYILSLTVASVSLHLLINFAFHLSRTILAKVSNKMK